MYSYSDHYIYRMLYSQGIPLEALVYYPPIPGHEVAGIIIAKGECVPEHVALGAKVTVSPYDTILAGKAAVAKLH